MYSLSCVSAFEVSDPKDTYIYDIRSCGKLVVTISSDDNLRVLDLTALNGPPLSQLRGINKDLTCLELRGNDGVPSVICTAGRDGAVCVVDFRNNSVVRKLMADQTAPILSLATTGSFGLAAGTELTNQQAVVSLWDLRNHQKALVNYVESHSDDVTELQFHSAHPQFLLSGSTDGLVNIYDTNITDEEDALYQTINHGHSIHHAGFLSDQDIFALSHDEQFSMYQLVTDFDEDAKEPYPIHFGDLRESLGGEYVANVLRRPDGGAVLGSGKHSAEEFKLFQLAKEATWSFSKDSAVALPGGHGTEIVRAFCFVDDHKMVLTAGEDGKVNAWLAN